MQSSLAPGSHLKGVLVVWDRDRYDFEVRKVSYRFAFPGGGPGLAVTLDNSKHLAYVESNAPSANGIDIVDPTLPLELSTLKELQEIVQIAARGGLGDFCSLVTEKNENILFMLESTDNGPVWHVTADGWDQNGLVAQLRMDIDAVSGAVRKRNLTRPTKR
jgi:hypothetical protein